MFRQVLNIPEARNGMPVNSAVVIGLDAVPQKQKRGPKELSIFIPANPSLREALEKFELDYKTANTPELQ